MRRRAVRGRARGWAGRVALVVAAVATGAVVLLAGVTQTPAQAARRAGSGSAGSTRRGAVGRTPEASASQPCVFIAGSVNDCASSDPLVTVDFINVTDTSGCTFSVNVDWGDGSPTETVPLSGGPPGAVTLATHTYGAPGTYSISASGSATGGCSLGSAAFQFTLGSGAPGTGAGQPQRGRTVELTVVSGTVLIEISGRGGFDRLTGSELVPVGTEIDVLRGRVLITVLGAGGRRYEAIAYGGEFFVRQDSTAPYVTHLVLAPLPGCSAGSGAADVSAAVDPLRKRPPSHPGKQSLWTTETGGAGAWTTNGGYGSTTVEGTEWVTIDTCTSTSVAVIEGVVAVLDSVNGRTVILHAHQRYRASRGEVQATPLDIVESFWAAIDAHAFARAYRYEVPGLAGSLAGFVASEQDQGITSAIFAGRTVTQTSTAATVAVVSLVTVDRLHGCRRWPGSYHLTHGPSGWLISLAGITPTACGG